MMIITYSKLLFVHHFSFNAWKILIQKVLKLGKCMTKQISEEAQNSWQFGKWGLQMSLYWEHCWSRVWLETFLTFAVCVILGDWLFQSQINLSRPLKSSPRMRLRYLNITYLRCFHSYLQVIHILRTKGNVFSYQLVTLF